MAAFQHLLFFSFSRTGCFLMNYSLSNSKEMNPVGAHLWKGHGWKPASSCDSTHLKTMSWWSGQFGQTPWSTNIYICKFSGLWTRLWYWLHSGFFFQSFIIILVLWILTQTASFCLTLVLHFPQSCNIANQKSGTPDTPCTPLCCWETSLYSSSISWP